jgi:hypothetical protein
LILELPTYIELLLLPASIKVVVVMVVLVVVYFSILKMTRDILLVDTPGLPKLRAPNRLVNNFVRWRLVFVDPPYETCFMSFFWNQEFCKACAMDYRVYSISLLFSFGSETSDPRKNERRTWDSSLFW